jgi:hypothetical protein
VLEEWCGPGLGSQPGETTIQIVENVSPRVLVPNLARNRGLIEMHIREGDGTGT